MLIDIDALKRSEQAIAAARDFAEAIIRTTRDPLLILDADLRIRTANAAFYATFNVSPAEAEGRSIYDLGNGQWNIPGIRQLLEDDLPRNSVFDSFEVTHDFESIGRRTMLLNARALNDGQQTLILLGIEDVTKRNEMTETLRQSAARLQFALDSARVGDWDLDLSTDVARRSLRHDQAFGYHEPIEQWGFEKFIQHVHPEDRADIVRQFRAAVSNQTDWHFECRVVWPDRSVHWIEVHGSVYHTLEGKPGHMLGIVAEITDRKQAVDALRASEERYRSLFDAAPMAVFVCDREGVIQYYNRMAAAMWGREPLCGVERHCGSVKLLLPDGTLLPHLQSPIVGVLRTGIPARNVDVLIERPDGSRLPVLVNFAALKNADGEVTGAITSFTDITERKQTEEALRRLADELAEADRHKNEFLAMLAHELRNPLAPIRNAIEILRRASSSEAIQTASAMMERQVGQMVRLVDDLLDVSRISRGRIELRREPVDLASAVRHAVEAHRPAMAHAHLELIVTLPPVPMLVNADPVRLAEVVGNLLHNACKFTDTGGRVWLTVARERKQAVIRVRDSGIGLAGDQLTRVFDMFVQVNTSRERARSGLGIGLTLVKKLVELHGGTVEVHSAGIGQGSEFIVRLPISDELPHPAPPTVPPSEPAIPRRRILVVDDNRDAATSLALLLQLAGHETHTAFDGLEALEAAASLRPDAVLLDIGLPKLNGYEAARRIREQPWGKHIVLVALTGWGQDDDRQRSRGAGFNVHLVKPVDSATLAKALADSPSTG